MPISALQERQLLSHYKLPNLYPDAWPHADDGEDSSDSDPDDQTPPQTTPNGAPGGQAGRPSADKRLSSSKLRNLERHASLRSVPTPTPDEAVQRDEPDALGMAPSVVAELKRRGVPVDEDVKLRNRFMLSSTSFSPSLYLRQVHPDASTADLLRGLEFLSNSIEQKSASLKVLVEANFEKFVRAKGTIDNVYTEMRTQGQDAPSSPATPTPAAASAGRRSSRVASRSQTHFRNTSGAFSPTAKTGPSDKKKNALTPESEYGVLGISAPLQDLAVKAEEVWGPALGGREKEETLKQVLAALDQHRDVFALAGVIAAAIKQNDYATVITASKSAQTHAAQARRLASTAQQTHTPLRDQDAQFILLTAQMHHAALAHLTSFKRSLWRQLTTPAPLNHTRSASADEADKAQHIDLIAVLLQLGLEEQDRNPIWQWLHARFLALRARIARTCARGRVEIEVARRRLAANETLVDDGGGELAGYLRAAAHTSTLPRTQQQQGGHTTATATATPAPTGKETDHPLVLAFWHLVLAELQLWLGALVGAVREFWETAQGFIDGRAQRAFPAAVVVDAEKLELAPEDVADLRAGAVELVDLLRGQVLALFADAPPEDLAGLYAPLSSSSSSLGEDLAELGRLREGLAEAPALGARRGEVWEKMAFWPPGGNALAGSHFLSRLLILVGGAAGELGGVSVVWQSQQQPQQQSHRGGNDNGNGNGNANANANGNGNGNSSTVGAGTEALKMLVGAVRERCVQALCAAWTLDTGARFKLVETWQRNGEVTTLPGVFRAYEEKVLAEFQRIAYIADDEGGVVGGGGVVVVGGAGGVVVVVTPPPAKLLGVVRGGFVTGLYQVLSGMVENAEKGREGGGGGGDVDGVTVAVGRSGVGGAGAGVEDGGDRNTRILLTLSNLAHLRSDILPHLITHFEAAFALKLTDESKTIRDVLGQIDARLFQSYALPAVAELKTTIAAGVGDPAWAPRAGDRPTDARGYVYEVLLALVLVHSEVSTTAASLTNQTLSFLLEQASLALLHNFKTLHSHYSLSALMQATLDVEFLAQTLNSYTTERAGEVQSLVYLALDERTDDEARGRLQGELVEMRGVLKRLREGTRGEFGCFRRERRGRGGGGGAGGSAKG
ncbi:hypothetical protein LTR08_004942 [Meristemomyces frigidus]|nr:hypothetical protein LTR08_004942 [Meristemomyces frigidus]